jgi:hypothetical protein
MPKTAIRWSAASPRRSARSPNCSAANGRVRRRSICRKARRRSPASCSATRRSPRPGAASSPRPAATANASWNARAAWYQGFVAAAIDDFCRREAVLDASGRRHAGLLTGADMARWDAPVEAPVTFDYHGWTVAKGGPWSQGPVLLQALALLQGFDLDSLDPVGPDFVHVVVESLKLALPTARPGTAISALSQIVAAARWMAAEIKSPTQPTAHSSGIPALRRPAK